MTYLDAIVEHKRRAWAAADVAARENGVTAYGEPGRLKRALDGPYVALIAEVKPKSPSKGNLLHIDDAVPQARRYSALGAAAVSALADTEFFGGSPGLVAAVVADPNVTVPVLYKDFVVDARQVRLAAQTGAAGVLLIVRAVDDTTLATLTEAARQAGLDPLHECSDEEDVRRALAVGADLIGINNRDLQTFAVDLSTAGRLRSLVPAEAVVVSESGLHSRADVEAIAALGFDACLVGEALLTADDLALTMAEMCSIAGAA
jgi:indole-3-glycerol phosphate synthase